MDFDYGLSRFPLLLPPASSFSQVSFFPFHLFMTHCVWLESSSWAFVWSRKTYQWLPLRNITRIPPSNHQLPKVLQGWALKGPSLIHDGILKDSIFFLYLSVLPVSTYVYHTYVRCPHRSEAVESPGNVVMDGCKPPCGFWEPNTGALQA